MNWKRVSAGLCVALGALVFVGIAWAQQDSEDQNQSEHSVDLKVFTFLNSGGTTSRVYENVLRYSINDGGVLSIVRDGKAIALSPNYWAKVEQVL